VVSRYDTFVRSPADKRRIIILKFGSSVLNPEDDFAHTVLEIYREVRRGKRVLAVVSALPGVTDRLVRAARRRFERPHPEALASLVSTGETSSAAFVGMALDRAGVPAQVLDPDRAGLTIRGPGLDAYPLGLDTKGIHERFERYPVLVLPGFIGRTENGSLGLMGRGGSDLTAIFVAHRLSASECRLLKDVNGLYTADPKKYEPKRRYLSASWGETVRVGEGLVQPKALRYAERHRVHFDIAAPLTSSRTRIGTGPVVSVSETPAQPPLRVSLLGLGTVGTGLYRGLRTLPKRFQLVGIAVRDLSKAREAAVPRDLLHDDPWQLLERPTDVVVELMGGREPAVSLIRASLDSGRHVVTANKEVLAHEGFALQKLAQSKGVVLEYSASVGGAVPAIEHVHHLACIDGIERIEGVLNGTCNFVLDRMAEGIDFNEAVREAQRRGFAEADPSLDLNGKDSAHKLAILARAAFGVELHPDEIPCRGIDSLRETGDGNVTKLVASCQRVGQGIRAEVRPLTLPVDHPLAETKDEENRIFIQTTGGRSHLLQGKGAGRWPTSFAVMAGLLDIYENRAYRQHHSTLVPALAEVIP
jgi:homoserine dehydrogenase